MRSKAVTFVATTIIAVFMGVWGVCAGAAKPGPESELLQDPEMAQWQFGDRTTMEWEDGSPVISAVNRVRESSFAITAVSLPQGADSVLIEADVRTEDVRMGDNGWEQARIHLTFHDEKGTQLGGWPEVGFWMGTMPWRHVGKSFKVPKGAATFRIAAGLQVASGKVVYGNVAAYALDAKRNPLKPLSRRVTNDTSTWYPWGSTARNPKGFMGSMADVSRLLDKPAGKHGFVKADGGRLVFADGTRARFIGVNLVAGTCFPDKATAVNLADRLASMGVNIVRLHHMDADWANPNIFGNGPDTLSLDPDSMDRLDYLIAQLKSRGIYIFMDLLVHRVFKETDGVDDGVEAGAKVTGQFDERLIALQKDYAKDLLTHLNPYTRLRYTEEPAIAMVDIINESSLFWVHDIPESYSKGLKAKWNRWLAMRYTTREALQAEWAKDPATAVTLGAVEDPALGTVEPSRIYVRHDARRAEYLRFLYEKQNGYYLDMQAYLRKLGVRVPITGSNHWDRTALDVASNARLDFVDQHGYWDHPQGGYGSNVTFDNRMMVAELGGLVSGLAGKRVQGKPYTVTEWQNSWPNEYRAEGLLPVMAYASLQGWDGLFQFDFGTVSYRPTIEGNFDVGNEPVRMAQWPLIAQAFHRGDVTEGSRPLVAYTDSASMHKGASVDAVMPAWAPLVDKVGHVFFAGETRPITPDMAPGLVDTANKRVMSRTGELAWNSSDAIVTVDTGLTKGAVGHIGKTTLKGLALDVTTPFAAVTMTSMDGKPLAESDRILVSAVARSENTGTVYSSARNKLLEPGTSPVLMEPVVGIMVLDVAPGNRTHSVYTLDADGRRQGKARSEYRDGRLSVFMTANDRSPWYAIVVE